jgi:hypothetical protein
VDKSRQFVQELEWPNYARTAYFATVVSGAEVSISSEVILVTDPEVPLMDGNHAAMLRTTPDRADALIERITRHYQERGLQPAVVISPACTPDDLPQRLEAHGFTQYGEVERWLTLEKPFYADALRPSKNIVVREIGLEGIPDFCRVMVTAYEMPEDVMPILVRNFGPINDLPGIHNYLAYLDGKPVGCMSMFSYLGHGALGSGGVLPEARRADVAFSLAIRGYEDWKKDGNKVMVFQTLLPWLERLLRIGGCKHQFDRTYYVLP